MRLIPIVVAIVASLAAQADPGAAKVHHQEVTDVPGYGKIRQYVVSPARTEDELRKLLAELHQQALLDANTRSWKSGGLPGLWIYVYPDEPAAAEGADRWLAMLEANPIEGKPDIDFSTVITRPVAAPKAQPGREVIGSWRRSSAGMHWVETIYRESETFKRESLYDDGSSEVRAVIRSKHRDGVKYADPTNELSEFVVVYPNGTLGFFDRDGKFGEGAPVR